MHHQVSTSKTYAKEKKTRSTTWFNFHESLENSGIIYSGNNLQKWLLGVKENADYKHSITVFFSNLYFENY